MRIVSASLMTAWCAAFAQDVPSSSSNEQMVHADDRMLSEPMDGDSMSEHHRELEARRLSAPQSVKIGAQFQSKVLMGSGSVSSQPPWTDEDAFQAEYLDLIAGVTYTSFKIKATSGLTVAETDADGNAIKEMVQLRLVEGEVESCTTQVGDVLAEIVVEGIHGTRGATEAWRIDENEFRDFKFLTGGVFTLCYKGVDIEGNLLAVWSALAVNIRVRGVDPPTLTAEGVPFNMYKSWCMLTPGNNVVSKNPCGVQLEGWGLPYDFAVDHEADPFPYRVTTIKVMVGGDDQNQAAPTTCALAGDHQSGGSDVWNRQDFANLDLTKPTLLEDPAQGSRKNS